MPAELRPPPATTTAGGKPSEVDGSLLGLIGQWRIVVAELAEHYGVDLYDPVVLARPWPGIRTMIFALVDRPGSRLKAALTTRR